MRREAMANATANHASGGLVELVLRYGVGSFMTTGMRVMTVAVAVSMRRVNESYAFVVGADRKQKQMSNAES
jgi:hypothetical protein